MPVCVRARVCVCVRARVRAYGWTTELHPAVFLMEPLLNKQRDILQYLVFSGHKRLFLFGSSVFSIDGKYICHVKWIEEAITFFECVNESVLFFVL